MRVLVADDDLVSRLAMEDVLLQCGPHELVLVADGAAAWDALCGEQFFDLLCLDIRMPPPDGLELAERLRAAPGLRRVPTLLITSTADRNAVQAATRANLQGFIVKPVGADTVGRIQRVLAQLDAALLEPAGVAMSRLRIDAERHARYVAAFVQQIRTLAALARELSLSGGQQAAARAAFLQKADACRTAALTLGSPRIEQVISDALAAVQDDTVDDTTGDAAVGAAGADRAMAQAAYWLARVTGA